MPDPFGGGFCCFYQPFVKSGVGRKMGLKGIRPTFFYYFSCYHRWLTRLSSCRPYFLIFLFFLFPFFGDVLEELTATSFRLGMYAVGGCLCMYVGKIFIVIRTAFILLRFVIMIRRRRVRGRTWEVTSLPCVLS